MFFFWSFTALAHLFQGGIYHKDTGVVEFLGRLPHQDQVLADWDAQPVFFDGQNLSVLFCRRFKTGCMRCSCEAAIQHTGLGKRRGLKKEGHIVSPPVQIQDLARTELQIAASCRGAR